MRWLIPVLVCAVAFLATACRAYISTPAGDGKIPLCQDVPRISAPPERYRDSPVYVANEQPTEEIRAWAAHQPAFEELWIDRDHLGWVVVAFSQDADARQAELEERFPGVGVAVIGVDWTMAEMHGLQRRVQEELSPLFPVSSGIYVMQGVVGIGIGVLSQERIGVVRASFAGERVCMEGADPASVPAPGPQARAGDGWRLLADEQGVGHPYRTGIATDHASYEELWAGIGLAGDPPPVAFVTEVVIWFGAVYGSSCPEIRLDDVVVDRERALVYAEIVLLGGLRACTGDARPHAYLVAVQRLKLPQGSLAIQLGASDPSRGFPEERTIVDVDLSQPGAVAGPEDIHTDPSLFEPEPFVFESGDFVEPGFPFPYRFFVHCGTEWLGRLNEVAWRTDVPADYIPPEWQPLTDADQYIEVSTVLHTDPEPWLEATANNHTVIYHPTADDLPGCD